MGGLLRSARCSLADPIQIPASTFKTYMKKYGFHNCAKGPASMNAKMLIEVGKSTKLGFADQRNEIEQWAADIDDTVNNQFKDLERHFRGTKSCV